MCAFRLTFWIKDVSHIEHLKGFVPVCCFRCVLRLPLNKKRFSQIRQENGLSFDFILVFSSLKSAWITGWLTVISLFKTNFSPVLEWQECNWFCSFSVFLCLLSYRLVKVWEWLCKSDFMSSWRPISLNYLAKIKNVSKLVWFILASPL